MQYFTVFGKQVGSHVLAMITLGSTGAIAAIPMFGGSDKKQAPPIKAESGDEEKFIRDFIAKAEMEEKEGAKH